MKRRSALALGVGACAAATGTGVAFWRHGENEANERFWSLRFPKPGGGVLVFADLRGKPLLLNFWATWCPPCVTEMPLLARFHATHRAAGWQVVGLAVDEETPVREFLAKGAIEFPVALAGAQGLDLARNLGNSAGGLPFSVAFAADGAPSRRKLGALDAGTLAMWAAAAG